MIAPAKCVYSLALLHHVMSGQLDYVIPKNLKVPIELWDWEHCWFHVHVPVPVSVLQIPRSPEVQKSRPDSRLKLQPPKNKFSEIKFDQIFWNIGISDATI